MGFLQDMYSGGSCNLVNTVGNTLDKVAVSTEENMQLESEMRKADMQYRVDIKKLTLEEQKMMSGEMESARKREVDVLSSQGATKFSKNIAPFLAIGTTALSFALFAFIIFNRIEQESKEIIFYMLGVLSAIITQIFNYYFGSSAGSAAKSQSMDKFLSRETEKSI